jgi:Endodeoxyribonuclease RusA
VNPIKLVVREYPAPQGSKVPFVRADGRAGMREDSNTTLGNWRNAVYNAALAVSRCQCGEDGCTAMSAGFPIKRPISVRAVFSFRRPQTHYRTGRFSSSLRDDAPLRPFTRAQGDLDKLLRSTYDSITAAGLIQDDKLIAESTRAAKVWCGEDPESLPVPGAILVIELVPDRLGPVPVERAQLLDGLF